LLPRVVHTGLSFRRVVHTGLSFRTVAYTGLFASQGCPHKTDRLPNTIAQSGVRSWRLKNVWNEGGGGVRKGEEG
jgi:hypothetical protein